MPTGMNPLFYNLKKTLNSNRVNNRDGHALRDYGLNQGVKHYPKSGGNVMKRFILKMRLLCVAAAIATVTLLAACPGDGNEPAGSAGTGSIEIALNDEGADLLDAASLTLSKTGATKTITLTAAREYSGFQWYVDTALKAADRSFTLNAASYAAGKHYLSLEAWRNGALYSKDLTFTVNE
jgi:hypothetical protein